MQANEYTSLQMIKRGVTEYASQALNVIFALLEDNEDEVANAAVCGLSPVSLQNVLDSKRNHSLFILSFCKRLDLFFVHL
jgi:hypothetical protein